jgi:hypothetical protein
MNHVGDVMYNFFFGYSAGGSRCVNIPVINVPVTPVSSQNSSITIINNTTIISSFYLN